MLPLIVVMILICICTYAACVGARVHAFLSLARAQVLIAGPTDFGKSTLCGILLAYAARCDRRPVFVDLDIGQGALTVPGAIAASPVDKLCLSVEVCVRVCVYVCVRVCAGVIAAV